MLNITTNTENTTVELALEGRLDTVTAPQFETAVKESLDGTTLLVLNFEKLAYISSAGLRVLLFAQKRMNEQGDMKVTHVGDTVKDIFEVTGFTDILTIE